MTTALPSGTVTFLFTDIEGSTRLLREIGRIAYGRRLATHRELIEGAVDLHGVEPQAAQEHRDVGLFGAIRDEERSRRSDLCRHH